MAADPTPAPYLQLDPAGRRIVDRLVRQSHDMHQAQALYARALGTQGPAPFDADAAKASMARQYLNDPVFRDVQRQDYEAAAGRGEVPALPDHGLPAHLIAPKGAMPDLPGH